MNLLKEYIRLLVEEAMDEDVNLNRLNPGMLGIYSLAQAINKLIYEGDALPGALPIDIISSGKDLKSAPMVTDTERKSGVSIQHTGSTFKLYIDPSKSGTQMSGNDETHDIVHTITGYIAKAIARRREDIEASGKYSGTPSRFNKITFKKEVVEDFNNKFQKYFGYRIPDSVFEKVFEYSSPADYSEWFLKTVYPKVKKSKINQRDPVDKKLIKYIGYGIYRAVFGIGQIIPGIFAKQYWGDTDVSNLKIDPTDIWSEFGLTRVPLGKDSPAKVSWKQSMEDEEMIGNIINVVIRDSVQQASPISVKQSVENVFNAYQRAPSPNVNFGNINAEDYNLRFNTPETRKALTRLFELYNQMLQRYTVGLSTAQPNRKQAAKAAEKQYDREQVTPAQLKAARQSLRAKREPSPFPEPAPVRRPRRAAAPARPTKKAPAKRTKR